MVIENQERGNERIGTYVVAHTPQSKTANIIDPERFPIHCSFTFAKRYAHLVDEVKELTKMLPKENFRVRKVVNRYSGICVNLYLQKADDVRPIAHGLKDKNLVVRYLGEEDKKIMPRELIEMAQGAQKEVGQGKGR